MIKAMILDQTQDAIILKGELEKFCEGQVEVVASYDSFEDAIPEILSNPPDLLFTEVFLGDRNAFDYLEKLQMLNMEVIFMCSACTNMVRSFKFEPVDFLLKPIDSLYLKRAIERCARRLTNKNNHNHTDFDLPLKDHKVVLRTEEGLSLISIQNIIRIEADRGYSIFYLGNGERIIVSQSLKLWDSMLNKYGFFRVHESHIVNLAFVKKFLKKDGGIITLKNGDEIYVARRRKEDLLQRLIELSIE